jgi:prolyl oligopeptidase PreP (S9A serine peptidase family)
LEDVSSERALSWVRERNAEAVTELAGGSRFEALRTKIREVLDSTDRIPYITRRGEYRYNFWRDREHPRGQWRRTTLAEYRKKQPDWEVLLDVDALARDEEENWVFHGAQCLRPDYRWALVSLSRGGADAAVLREFDIEHREFVADGFVLPAAIREPSGNGGAAHRWPTPSWFSKEDQTMSGCPPTTTTLKVSSATSSGESSTSTAQRCTCDVTTGCAASTCLRMRSSTSTGSGC